MYFTDQNTICGAHHQQRQQQQRRTTTTTTTTTKNQLIFPGIDSLPQSWEEPHDGWVDNYFYPRMGQHKSPKQESHESCKNRVPLQLLYSKDGSSCKPNGFVWFHINTNTTGIINPIKLQEDPSNNWEKPNEYILRAVVREPDNCAVDLVNQGHVTTIHVFFRNSTEACDPPTDTWPATMAKLQESNPEKFADRPISEQEIWAWYLNSSHCTGTW